MFKRSAVVALGAVLAGCVGTSVNPSLTLTRDGKGIAYIKLQQEPSPSEQLAATEIQEMIEKISGAKLSVAKEAGEGVSIEICTLENAQALPKTMQKRLAAAKSEQAFYLKTTGNKIRIVGKKPLGALYGAYTFLEELGVRWLYPGEQGECYPELPSITIGAIDRFETPSLPYRSVCLTCASYNFAPTLIWMARNKMGIPAKHKVRIFDNCTQKQADFFNAARGALSHMGGHSGFRLAVPAKEYFGEHPEYFPLIDGKRVCEGRVQRCVSNPEVQKIYEDMVCDWTRKGCHYFFGAADRVGTWCQCDKCRAMGTADGKYSETNLVHRFFSDIEKRVLKRNPDAKFFMHIYTDYRKVPTAPDIRYSTAMNGFYCSHGRCYVHEFSDPSCVMNKKQYAEFRGWQKICPRVSLRDYLQIAHCEYAPFEYVVAKDIKDLVRIGAEGWTDECPPPLGRLVPRLAKAHPLAKEQWLSTWPIYYVAAKVGWDSNVDTDELMTDAYRTYYGATSPPMLRYHARRRKLWESAPGHAFYGGPHRTGFCLTVPGAEEELNSYLKEAEELAADNQLLLKRIAQDKHFLDKFWKAEAAKRKKLFSAERKIVASKSTGSMTIDGVL